MNEVDMRDNPEFDFGALGNKWISRVRQIKDFESIFMKHLSEYVFKCFELHFEPNLKVLINEEKCQRMIFGPLECFICGEDPSIGFQKLQSMNAPSQLCGRVFKVGEPTYSCRDCGYDSTCVLCIDCFQKSIHKNHHYKMNTSGGGGFCDCGDVEAWKNGVACDTHQHTGDTDMEENPMAKLPQDVLERGVDIYSVVLNYCIDLICWDKTDELPHYLDVTCNEDNFATVLFNDEVHTYEEVIRTLQQAIPRCTQTQALAYANIVDREGRSIVRSGSYSECEHSRRLIKQGTSGPSHKPLKCRVMHHKVIAHQMCAVQMLGWLNKITNYSDGLKRILCNTVLIPKEDSDLLSRVLLSDATLWKVARAHTHKLFMNTMLMDPVGKKAFAIHFTKHYSQIQKDFVEDDHEHSVSVTSLSVQLYTVPTIARMLILEHNVLEVILLAFMDQLQPFLNDQGTFEFQKQSLKLRRAHFMMIDLKYILLHKPTEWTEELRGKFIKFLDKFFGLLKCMQGMDMVTRKTGRHIETEPDYEGAFTLQIRMMPVYTLVYDWCFSDVLIFRTAILESIKTLLEARKKQEEVVMKALQVSGRSLRLFRYDVSSLPISVHLPVSRFLAGLLLFCDKFQLSFWELFGFETQDDRLKLFLMEYPLRTLVMVAQVQAGMWRRNGYSVINQVFNYLNVRCRADMFDKDVIMLQVVASFLESDYFMLAMLDKFDLVDWSRHDFDDTKYDQEKLNQKLAIAESFFSLLIAIVGERYMPGVGRVSADDFMRREIIHRLCIRPMTHSELIKALPLLDNELEDEEGVDGIIESVSIFKKPGVTGRGLYELKEEYLKDYNQFFYHYTRIEQSKAEEQQRKRVKKENEVKGGPPPIPPEFCAPFSKVLNVLCCRTLVGLMNSLIGRATTVQPRAVTDLLVQQVLHLICLALHEEKRHRMNQKMDEFNFISMATSKQDNLPSLLASLESFQSSEVIEEHSAQLDWIIKTFHEELVTREHKLQGVGTVQRTPLERSTSQEEEKARRAKLAQERRAKIMAQMSALQKAFIKENAELLASMETESPTTVEPSVAENSGDTSQEEPVVLGVQRCRKEMRSPRFAIEPCILCQEQQEVNSDGRAIVMASFVQRSTVLSRSRGKMFDNGDVLDPLYTPGDHYWGVHVSSCGHMMHSDCWQGFYTSVVVKERRALRLGQHFSVDVTRREYLCPLCGCISNTVLPVVPALFSGRGEGVEEVTIPEFLSSLQDLVSSNLSVLSEEDEKKPSICTDRLHQSAMAVGNPGKARLNIGQRFLQTPEGRLYRAAKDGDIEGVAAACAEGAKLDVPHPEFGSQPLVMATLNGHTECVHYLLEERADVEQRNKFGWTPLLAACSKGNVMMSGYLIARMADVSAQDKLGRTPLHNAVAAGCDELAKGLLEEKADVNARTKDGKTVLSIELGRPKRQSKELENLLTEKMGLPFPKGYVKNMLQDLPPSFALLFPGQGSQRLGMLGWAEDHEIAWPMIQKANEILGYDLFDLTEIGPEEKLDELEICQAAIFVAAMCGLEWLKDQEGKDKGDAAAAAGMSCGELAALCTAGCFSFEDGVRLARLRGELMKKAVEEQKEAQKMISVVGLTDDEAESLCEDVLAKTGGTCQVANRLFPCGVALSGTLRAVQAAKALAKERGAQKVADLKGCNAAFHTELMKPAEADFKQHLLSMLRSDTLKSPEITVYSSQTGERWLPGTPASTIAEGLVQGLSSPNQWEDTCRTIIDDGVEFFWEIGPMKQLRAMMSGGRNISTTTSGST